MHLNHFFFSLFPNLTCLKLRGSAPKTPLLLLVGKPPSGRSFIPFTKGSYFLWLSCDLHARKSLRNQYQYLQGMMFYLPACWPTPDFDRSHFSVHQVEFINRFGFKRENYILTSVIVQKMNILGPLIKSIQYITPGIRLLYNSPIIPFRHEASRIKMCIVPFLM